MMKKYLKMIGNIMLYMFLYIVVSCLISLVVALLVKNKDSLHWIRNNPSILTIMINIPTLLVYMLIAKIRKQNFKVKYHFNSFNYHYIYLIILIGISLGIFSTSFLRIHIIKENFSTLNKLLKSITAGDNLIITLLGTITMGSILEEVLFRGLIFEELKKNTNIIFAVIVQGLLLGVFTLNISAMIYAGIGGVIFGVIYIVFRSIWAAILAHMISSTVLLIFSKWSTNLISEANAVYAAALSIIILAASLYMILKYRNKIQNENNIQTSTEQPSF